MFPIRLIAIIVLGSCVLALGACGGGKRHADRGVGHLTDGKKTASTPAATDTPAATEGPFTGSRGPFERAAPANLQLGLLTDVRADAHQGFDRLVFEFEGEVPGYRIEYVHSASQCGSGEPVTVGGGAMLQVRMSPIVAPFSQQEIAPVLHSIYEAKQSCDFEGKVTWVVGLPEELDARVSYLNEPPRLIVDVAQRP